MKLFESDMKRDAVIDATGQYRYMLSRVWGDDRTVTWIMLNPSTADALHDDPTIRRCIAFTRRWGYGGLSVVNLFAYRATSPRDLMRANDPVGPDHQLYFRRTIDEAAEILVAWGSHAAVGTSHVRDLLAGKSLWCLGVNKDGNPKHPLYVKIDVSVQKWEFSQCAT